MQVIDSGVVSTSATVSEKGSSGNRDAGDHKEKPRGKPIQRGDAEKLDTVKKRKLTEKTTDISGKKQNKLAKKQFKENSDAENDDDGASGDDESQSAAEKPGKVTFSAVL